MNDEPREITDKEKIRHLEEKVKELEAIYNSCNSQYKTLWDKEIIAKERAEQAESRIKEFDLALQSLTPSGSEFVNDPQRCVEIVRQIRDGHLELIHKFAKRANDFESRLKKLQEAVDSHKRDYVEIVKKLDGNHFIIFLKDIGILNQELYKAVEQIRKEVL